MTASNIRVNGGCVNDSTDNAGSKARWQKATDIRWDMMREQRRADELYDRLSEAGANALMGENDRYKAQWEEWQELLGSLSGLEMAYDTLTPDGMEDNIKEWYMSEYPDDRGSSRIKKGATFADLDDVIDTGGSYESVLGKDDNHSTVTRRCMMGLAELWGVTYDDLYGVWVDRI